MCCERGFLTAPFWITAHQVHLIEAPHMLQCCVFINSLACMGFSHHFFFAVACFRCSVHRKNHMLALVLCVFLPQNTVLQVLDVRRQTPVYCSGLVPDLACKASVE